ncbi:MAG: DUF5603 domain-containing protein [Sulfolobales archaeon]|nr:DUF5603 domain-containing protein [Sulfolobales archaeon]MCX8199192.1 DUF5603 domain-containing protein [Sulfolobales archaeon]MDW8170172.1 DUF5603 domain-containing protein [Desulfurococcaceae archaeon]
MSYGQVVIKAPKLTTPVKRVKPILLDLDLMRPHEEIISKRLNDVKEFILSIKAVDSPLIVAPIPSAKFYLIVDGHHRWAALKELKCTKAPSIIVDYFDESIKLYTWYPAFKGELEEFFKALDRLGVKYSECRRKSSGITLANNAAFVLLNSEGACIEISGDITVEKAVSKVLDELSLTGLIKLYYYGLLEHALEDLASGEVSHVLVRRKLTKEEVMSVVIRGEVLAPKTTRHVLPFTPEETYTPLSLCCTQ